MEDTQSLSKKKDSMPINPVAVESKNNNHFKIMGAITTATQVEMNDKRKGQPDYIMQICRPRQSEVCKLADLVQSCGGSGWYVETA